MDTTLGIDLGTQSLKVVFYDYNAREVVASAWSNTKKKAEQHAAHAALIKLKVLDE